MGGEAHGRRPADRAARARPGRGDRAPGGDQPGAGGDRARRVRARARVRDGPAPGGPAVSRRRGADPRAPGGRLLGGLRAGRIGRVPRLPPQRPDRARPRHARGPRRPGAAHGADPRRARRPGLPHAPGARAGRLPDHPRRADARRRARGRGDGALAPQGRAVRRAHDRPRHDVRRAGRDRDPERRAPARAAPARARARPLRRRAARAGRDQPGGRLDAGPRRGADDDRHARGAALGRRRRLDLRVPARRAGVRAAHVLRHQRGAGGAAARHADRARRRPSSAGPRPAAPRSRRPTSRRRRPIPTSPRCWRAAGARCWPSRCCARTRSSAR